MGITPKALYLNNLIKGYYMLDKILEVRFSALWYLSMIIIIIIVTTLLYFLKKKAVTSYKKISKLIITTLWGVIIIISVIVALQFLVIGFSADRVSNYTGIVLIIGPITIALLISYALLQEKRKNK